MRTAALVKMAAMGMFVVTVMIFGSIAWFTSNKENAASGIAITVGTFPFEIASKGTQVRNASQFSEVRPTYSEGVIEEFMDDNNVSGDYWTAQNTDGLKLRFTPVEDDPETLDVDESETPDIGPGSMGDLSLYIIPKVDGDIDAYIDLNIVSFKEVKEDENVTLVENADDLTDSSGLTNEQIIDCQEATRYLNGHIMFFEGLSSSPETYSYVKPVSNRRIHFHKDNAISGKAYPIPIYWT